MTANLLDRKLELWKHRLLDLGKRNRMINFRDTKRSTLKLIEPSYNELFRRIALNEETMTFQRIIDRSSDIRVYSMLSLLDSLSVPLTVKIGDIDTDQPPAERQKTLKNMRSSARLAQEEQGTNILYLAFGFLEWKEEKGASAPWIRSPLVMVPAILSLPYLHSPFTLSKHEDDIVVNPTLEYYMQSQMGITLPPFDEDKESLDEYFDKVEAVADQNGWRVVREASLALLSFLKITMYNDLVQNEERIKENPVIKAICGDGEDANQLPDIAEDFTPDSIDTADCYQVMSADSSQQDAIHYSKHNVSFVMQGPPGTGKSQTITNIIAEALAQGKKILFVSEKMAALQVVYRRLQEARLGDFCLPLHSYRANKKEILQQIGSNLKLKPFTIKDSAMNQLGELLTTRQDLNRYAEELHRPVAPLNLSCYEVFGKLETLKDTPHISFTLADVSSLTQNQLQIYHSLLRNYKLAAVELGGMVQNNPWEGITCRRTSYEYTQKLNNALADGVIFLTFCKDGANSISECPDLYDKLTPETLPDFATALNTIVKLSDVPLHWTESYDLSTAPQLAAHGKQLYEALIRQRREINKVFADSIFTVQHQKWVKETREIIDRLVSFDLLAHGHPDEYYRRCTTLITACITLRKELGTMGNLSQSINQLLGTAYAPTAAARNTLSKLHPLLQTNIIFPKIWFATGSVKVATLLQDAKRVSMELMSCQFDILQDWEYSILSLDYAPILIRYRTEYTGFFKSLSRQYHADQKRIKGFSKTVLKKLRDENAVELLCKLQTYHEKEAWLQSHETELIQYLGSGYAGVHTHWDAFIQAVGAARELETLFHGAVPDTLQTILSADHSEQVAGLTSLLEDYDQTVQRIKTVAQTNHLKLNLSTNALKLMETVGIQLESLQSLSYQAALIAPHLLQSDTPYMTIVNTLAQVSNYEQTATAISEKVNDFQAVFDFLYEGEETDWDDILRILATMNELRQSVYYQTLAPLVHSHQTRKAELSAFADELATRLPTDTETCRWLTEQFDSEEAMPATALPILLNKLSNCLSHIDLLEKFIDYREAKNDCVQNGLEDFICGVESASLIEEIQDCFLAGVYRMWLETVFEKADALRRFRRSHHDQRISRFIELDDFQLLIAQMRIREKLIAGLPTTQRLLKATDEVAILNKELSKKRNIMPLRKLFRQIPNLLLRLKPCLMMSPLSVSYFLETEAYHFDLVIFDEASQIFPEDAIGAIFRGAQVIIAGDSKQLPPTNFFAAATTDTEEEYDAEDGENISEIISDSILEESASVLPNRTLLWHYRSRHESLIAFSNREIYQNNLITFPDRALQVPDMGVEYIYVANGVYEGGGKNRNVPEAEKCVELVEEHIQRHPDRSLGIIAFSEKQQTAIEDEILKFRRQSPQYEWFFDESREEPFFVKNLENVQGDERDTILFSICYAKDKNGRMYMRFGPLGHEGGERRLNVAITRAKCNIKIVGSIYPTDIDLNRTNAEGVRMLRAYIEFAGRGTSSLPVSDGQSSPESADLFCDMIGDFLTQHGYTVRKHLGYSDYKVDLAVEDPHDSNCFIAGIECDGQSYIQAKTARDRDHLRKNVMESRGWNLYRVWSTEWNRNPLEEGEALLEFLRSLTDGDPASIIKSMDHTDSEMDEIVKDVSHKDKNSNSGNPFGFSYYTEANWSAAKHSRSKDQLTIISETVLHILHTEQPMHMDLLYKRMAPSFNGGKVTETVKNRIDLAISHKLSAKVAIDSDRFIRLIPETPLIVRIPKPGDSPRPMEYIPTEEVAAAMLRIAEHSIGIAEDDLTLECARIFGFERKGQRIKIKTDAAIRYLTDSGAIRMIDGKVQLTGGA